MINALTEMFGGEPSSIPYRKNLAVQTGSILSAIFLQQVAYRWIKHHRKAFYKFNEPCNHKLYAPYDSWTEELGTGVKAFTEARDKVSTKAKDVAELKALLASDDMKCCVVYIKNRDNLTWYYFNPRAFSKLWEKACALNEEESRVRQEHSAKRQNGSSRNDETAVRLYTEDYNTEEVIVQEKVKNYFEEETSEKLEAKEPEELKQPTLPKGQGKYDKKAKTMPIDFQLENGIIAFAVSLGYSQQDVDDEARKFIHYYSKGKGVSQRQRDWQNMFVNFWLDSSYKKGYLKRNGEIYTLSADEERKESIRKLSDPNLFSDIED